MKQNCRARGVWQYHHVINKYKSTNSIFCIVSFDQAFNTIEAFSTALQSPSSPTKDVFQQLPHTFSHLVRSLRSHFQGWCFCRFTTVCGIHYMLPPVSCVGHPRHTTDEAYRKHVVNGKSLILTNPSRNADLTPGSRSNA